MTTPLPPRGRASHASPRAQLKVGIDGRNLIARPSGIGRYLVETARELVILGCDVTLYLPSKPHPEFSGIDGARFEIANHRGAVARSVWGQTVLPRLAAADDVDVFWGPAHRLPRRLRQSIPRVMTVLDLVWVHAPETMHKRTWLGERLFMGPSVRAADLIVAISQATAEDVRQRYHLPTDRVVTIHPGATALPMTDDLKIRIQYGLDKPYALFVGTLEPRKNLERLIAAYASLPAATRSRCKLAIAGGKGWRMTDVAKIIAKAELGENVVLLGHLSDVELGHLFAHARFLAMPSLYEGFGLPIVEANVFGVPVLTSNRSSMPECAGQAGHFVDPTDIASIAAGFSDLVLDDTLHQRLANAAKANAARFDWRRSAQALVAVFERAVAERKRV